MPSKKSKPRPSTTDPSPSPWKLAPSCSERELGELARELALVLQSGHRVLLEGPMGAGKTTFARLLLASLGVHQPPEGSPSFAIAHEYDSPKGEVVHMDLYRIKAEEELEEAGILAYFWERQVIAITEWLSNWPGLEAAVRKSGPCWRVSLDFAESEERRKLTVFAP